MIEKIYDFTDATDFTDTTKIVDGTLIVQDNPGQLIEIPFDSETEAGSTFDSDLFEFTGTQGQQKDRTPTDVITYANYDDDKDLNYGSGTDTGTLGGTAAVTSGQLDLTGGNASIEYPVDNLTTMVQEGCIIIRWTPNYTGNAPAIQYLFQSSPNTTDRIMIRHLSNQMQVYGFCAGVQTASITATWTATAGTMVEMAFNFDFTGGDHRLFIDGTLADSDTGTGTRGGNTLFRIGASANQEFSVDDILIYDTVQHTSNYTPDWSGIPAYKYEADKVILPVVSIPSPGVLVSLDSCTSVYGGSPLYTVGSSTAVQMYWDGAAWGFSNQTYAQASTEDEICDNFHLLFSGVWNENIYIMLYTPDDKNQAYVDDIEIEFTGQILPTDDPYIVSNVAVDTQGIESISEDVTKTGDDDITRVQLLDGEPYYHDGNSWVTSDYSFAQSNSLAEVLANITSLNVLMADGVSYKTAYIFHSEDGLTTPVIATDTIGYDFWAGELASANTCIVYGYINDTIASGNTTEIKVYLNKEITTYNGDRTIRNVEQTVTPNSEGYWEIELIETENMSAGTYYIFNFGANVKFTCVVPDQTSALFQDLEVV